MIEYLLVLTITVALVVAVARGVGRPIGDYLQANVLDVVGCMLRVGQFPTQSFGICQEAVQANLDVAGNLNSTGAGSGGSSANSSGNNNDSSDGDDEGSGSNDGSDSSDDSGGARVRSGNRTGSLNDSGGDSPFESGTTKKVKISNDDSGGGELRLGTGNSNFGDTTIIVRRIKRKEERIGGSFSIEGDQNNSGEQVGGGNFQSTSSQTAPQNEFASEQTKGRFSIPKSKDGPRNIASAEEPNFSFIGMIKWIVIIAVLFFIIVFAASQLNSIRKGWTD